MTQYIGDPSITDRIYLSPYQEEGATIDRGDGVAVRYGGYVFLNLGIHLDDIENSGEFILGYTAKISPKQIKRNVLFADGHVEWMEEQALQAALPEGVDVDALDGP